MKGAISPRAAVTDAGSMGSFPAGEERRRSRVQAGRKRALVAGAGMGGLAAAAALAPFFDEVRLFDKDRLPEEAVPRAGAPQGRHVHALLRGGEAALESLLPGLRGALVAVGAVESVIGLDYRVFDYGAWRPRRDLGATILCMSRSAYEAVLRARVAGLENVSIETGARVQRVVLEDGAATGLVVARGGADEVFEAGDFVVDARGRSGALARDLDAAGWPAPEEDVIGIGLSYATARFAKPSDHRGSREIVGVMPSPPEDGYGLLFPVENEEWVLSLSGRGEGAPPTDIEGFRAFAARLPAPDIAERIADAELVAPIERYRMPRALWRRYDRLGRFPRRLAPVGDAIACVNPVFGQGMTVAAKQAAELRAAFDGADEDGFARDYLARAAGVVDEAWTFSSSVDLAYPEVTGERPADFALQQAFRLGLRLLADEDPEVHRLSLQISQMERPTADLRNIALVARAMAKARAAGA